jgi:hypothetical protein
MNNRDGRVRVKLVCEWEPDAAWPTFANTVASAVDSFAGSVATTTSPFGFVRMPPEVGSALLARRRTFIFLALLVLRVFLIWILGPCLLRFGLPRRLRI